MYLAVQEEYGREGVDASHVTYTDNRPLLELLMSVRRTYIVIAADGFLGFYMQLSLSHALLDAATNGVDGTS